MTDLHQSDPKLNIYYRDKRIRQHLIKAGLINRRGEIIPPKTDEVTRKKSSKTNDKNIKEKQKDPKQLYREFCMSLSNVHQSPSATKKKRSRTRSKSAHHLSSDSKKHLDHSAKNESQVPERCRVVMTYYGQPINIDYDNCWFRPKGDEIVILQQHCGGENLIVFKGYCKPNDTFAFDSRRHPDYPFALSFYINGLIDSRISVCCEYRHKRNVPLGGKHGFFAITDVQKVKPCRGCQSKRRRKKKTKPIISLALEPSRYQKSVVLPRNRSPSPIIRGTPSPPSVPLPTKRRSPSISRTPTPPVQKKQSPTASQNNDDDNYASDFDEPNDEYVPPSNSRFGRPRISDSHSSDKNQEDGADTPRTSSSISRKSGPSNDKDNNRLPKVLNGRSDNIDHSPKSSSSDISRKSGPSEGENDHYMSKSLTGGDNDDRNSERSSSTISRKSGPSPRDDPLKEIDEKNNDIKNRLLSIITSNNDTGDQKLSSDSKDHIPTTSSTKKDTEIHYPPKLRRTLSDEFFGDKNKDTQDLSSILYRTTNKTDTDDNDETNIYSTPKSRSWLKDSNSDEDD